MAYTDTPTSQVAISPWIGYKAIPSSFANAGDTGLTTGKAYMCFDVADLDSLTEAQSVAATGSCKQIIFALVKEFYDWYANPPATAAAPEKLVLTQTSYGNADSGVQQITRHELMTTHAISTTVASE